MSDNESMDKLKHGVVQAIAFSLALAWCVLAFSDPDPRTIWYDIFIWSTVSYLFVFCAGVLFLLVRWLRKLYRKATEDQLD